MIKTIINDNKYEYWDIRELTRDLFKQIMVNCEYRSLENLKENSTKLISFILDEAEPDKKFAKKLKESQKWLSRAKDKDNVIVSIYNLMLSTEGLSNLTGFGEALKTELNKNK